MYDDEFYPETSAAGSLGDVLAPLNPESPSFIGTPQKVSGPVMAPPNTPLANLPSYYIQMSQTVPAGSPNWNTYQAAARDATLRLAATQTVPAAIAANASSAASAQLLGQQQAILTGPEPTTAAQFLARGSLRTAEAGKYPFTDPNFMHWTELANSDFEKAKTVVTAAAPDRVLSPAELNQVLATPIPAYNAPVELQKWITYYLTLAHSQQVQVQ